MGCPAIARTMEIQIYYQAAQNEKGRLNIKLSRPVM